LSLVWVLLSSEGVFLSVILPFSLPGEAGINKKSNF